MKKQLFSRQFIFTSNPFNPLEEWKEYVCGNYTLYSHPKLEITTTKKEDINLILIGYFFDYKKPKLSNLDIITQLCQLSFNEYLRKLDSYTGQFAIIRKENKSLTFISDAGAQREIYYSTDYSTFASQPKLIAQAIETVPLTDKDGLSFYQSNKFKNTCLHIHNKTHWQNVKHLTPNHYLDLSNQKSVRFFPYKPREEKPFEYVVEESIKRITGYFEAVSNRYKVALPVTAGYDSRLLFAASLKIKCRRFIFKHRKLNEKHYDVAIPRKLLKLHNLNFEVITYNKNADNTIKQLHHKSVDFARDFNTAMIYNGYQEKFSEYMVVDTIMSELARNKYGNFMNLNAKDLAYLNGYKNNTFVIGEYKSWLHKGADTITDNNYNIPDLFYWEEIMGNWAAKYKTEYMLGTEFFSLLNSRELIDLFLSVPIKYRQSNNHILYNRIIKKLSPEALSLSVNPSLRTSTQKLMQKFRIFDLYRFLKIKLRI